MPYLGVGDIVGDWLMKISMAVESIFGVFRFNKFRFLTHTLPYPSKFMGKNFWLRQYLGVAITLQGFNL